MKNDINNKLINRRRALGIIGVASIAGSIYSLKKYKEYIKEVKFEPLEWKGYALGAPARIVIHHPEKKEAEAALEKILSDINYYENLFSLYLPYSEISRLNREGKIKNPSSEMVSILKKSAYFSNLTSGSFDITVQPLWNLYSQHFKNNTTNEGPSSKRINSMLHLVDWQKIYIDDSLIQFETKNMGITLNGIAQGWITDKVAKRLEDIGINNVLVDLGETYGLGAHHSGRDWNIAVQGPYKTGKTVNLRNSAVATSGGYGTVFESSGKHHHIFNPKTGLSANIRPAISVVAKNATTADAIATAAICMQDDKIRDIASNLNLEVFSLNSNGVKIL
tara:strand:+ start:478 stop:1482 length:1005 start_codon:yes stop_codon:yes gene_type:complete